MKYVLKTAPPVKPPFDLERELNPQQRAVVEAPPGELLILAGAGTGKTRTLTYRVARLIAAGCKPERTMLVTFTNRAAREMVGRVESLLGLDMRRCSAGTFHHVGHRLLRRHGEALGFGSDFGILDPDDGRELIASVVNELGLSVLTSKRFPAAKLLINMISQASGSLCSVATIVDRRFPNFLDQLALIDKVAIGFRERKRKLNLVDFDDLLSL
jgi:DNA helicase-2/ATP-dependent DNA helicase PcrA